MHIHVPSILILLSLLLAPVPAQAALRTQGNTPNASFNPNADGGDIALPMPGGLKFVLRAVAVPAQSALDDKAFTMGVSAPGEGRSFYERNFSAHISAPFTQKNLPASFKSHLKSNQEKDFCYYFIGKYELTNAQWHAVMGGSIPSGEKPEWPKADISWYDIQQFLEKYNLWLLSNAPQSVPTIEGSPSFLRLPTEPEWEFAARGGNLPPEQQEEDFPLDGGKTVADYAVFGQNYTNPMPIGTKNPNRLGIYDMAGNIAELTQTPFRFSIVARGEHGKLESRLHGSGGGLVVKGGHFLNSSPEDVYPGSRSEARMFSKAGGGYEPYKTRSLGARLVLASINVPGSQKTKELLSSETRSLPRSGIAPSQSAALGKKAQGAPGATPEKDAAIHVRQDGDLLEEIDRIYTASSSEQVRKNLTQYKELLKTTKDADAKKEEAYQISSIRSTLYKAAHIISCGYQCFMADYLIRTKRKGHASNTERPELDLTDDEKRLILPRLKGLIQVTSDYRHSLKEIANYPEDVVKKAFRILREEYSGKDQTSLNIQKSSGVVEKELDQTIEQGLAPSLEAIWNDIANTFQTGNTMRVIKRYLKQTSAR